MGKGKKRRKPIEAAAAEEIPSAAPSPPPASTPGQKKLALLAFGAALLIVLLVVLLLSGGGGSNPSVPVGDVAIVKGVADEIAHVSESEFDLALFRQAVRKGIRKRPPEGSKEYEELKNSAMGKALEAIWVRGQAEDLGIEVPPKEVAHRLAQLKARNFKSAAQYRQSLKQLHISAAEARLEAKIELLNSRLKERSLKDGSPLSKSQIRDYYDANKDKFTTPETRNIRSVANPDKSTTEEAKRELEADNSAGSWQKVAALYSDAPSTKEKGGLYFNVSRAQLKPPLREAVFSASPGVLTSPIAYQAAFFVVEVEKVNPGSVQPLKKVAASIRQKLLSQASSRVIADYEDKWIARSFCAPGFVTDKCANYDS